MIIKPNRPSHYICTIQLNDALDLGILAMLRRRVKEHNAFRGSPRSKRISVQGRLGKDNPNAYLYRQGGGRDPQRILLEHAAHADVYVHERYA